MITPQVCMLSSERLGCGRLAVTGEGEAVLGAPGVDHLARDHLEVAPRPVPAASISGAHRAICGAQQSYCTAYPLALENIRPLLPGSLVIQQQLCPVEGCGASSFIGRTRTRPNGPARLRTCARVTP